MKSCLVAVMLLVLCYGQTHADDVTYDVSQDTGIFYRITVHNHSRTRMSFVLRFLDGVGQSITTQELPVEPCGTIYYNSIGLPSNIELTWHPSSKQYPADNNPCDRHQSSS
jgi:hypothetical protein